MAFNNRKYVIIPADSEVDFSEVMETSKDTCRYSVDGTKTFIKYEGEMPTSVAAITSKSQEYTHDEIITILQTEEWTPSFSASGDGLAF